MREQLTIELPAERKADPLEEIVAEALVKDLGLPVSTVTFLTVCGVTRRMTQRLRVAIAGEN